MRFLSAALLLAASFSLASAQESPKVHEGWSAYGPLAYGFYGWGAHWSPTGERQILPCDSSSGFVCADANGRTFWRRVGRTPGTEGIFLPDGRLISYEPRIQKIYYLDPATGAELRAIATPPLADSTATNPISPSGKYLLTGDGSVIDLETGAQIGKVADYYKALWWNYYEGRECLFGVGHRWSLTGELEWFFDKSPNEGDYLVARRPDGASLYYYDQDDNTSVASFPFGLYISNGKGQTSAVNLPGQNVWVRYAEGGFTTLSDGTPAVLAKVAWTYTLPNDITQKSATSMFLIGMDGALLSGRSLTLNNVYGNPDLSVYDGTLLNVSPKEGRYSQAQWIYSEKQFGRVGVLTSGGQANRSGIGLTLPSYSGPLTQILPDANGVWIARGQMNLGYNSDALTPGGLQKWSRGAATPSTLSLGPILPQSGSPGAIARSIPTTGKVDRFAMATSNGLRIVRTDTGAALLSVPGDYTAAAWIGADEIVAVKGDGTGVRGSVAGNKWSLLGSFTPEFWRDNNSVIYPHGLVASSTTGKFLTYLSDTSAAILQKTGKRWPVCTDVRPLRAHALDDGRLAVSWVAKDTSQFGIDIFDVTGTPVRTNRLTRANPFNSATYFNYGQYGGATLSPDGRVALFAAYPHEQAANAFLSRQEIVRVEDDATVAVYENGIARAHTFAFAPSGDLFYAAFSDVWAADSFRTPTWPDKLEVPERVGSGATVPIRIVLPWKVLADEKITLSASVSGVVTLPASVVVPAGASEVTVNATAASVTAEKTTSIKATLGRLSRTANLVVGPAQISGISLSPASTKTGTVVKATLAFEGTPANNTSITLKSNDALTKVPSSVKVAKGVASFDVTVGAGDADRTATISATLNGRTVSANLTIQGRRILNLALDESSLTGGNVFGLEATLDGAAATNLSLPVSVVAGSPVTGGTLTVQAGQKTGMVWLDSASVATDQDVTLSVTLNGEAKTISVRLLAPRLVGAVLSPTSIRAGKTTTLFVQLDGEAPAGFRLPLSFDGTLLEGPTEVIFPAGAAFATVTLKAKSVASVQKTQVTVGGTSKALKITP